MDGEQGEEHKDGRRGRISPRDLLKALPVDAELVEVPKPLPQSKPKVEKQPRAKANADATKGKTVGATGEGDQVASNTQSKPPYKVVPRWKPGQSGNPAGRPKALHDFQGMCREASPKAFQKIMELMDSADERVSFMAANTIIDRAWGKPKTTEGDEKIGGVTINIVKLATNEALEPKPAGAQVITLKRFSDD